MAALDSAIVGPVLPALRKAFGINNRTAGLLTTVFALSSMFSTALMAYSMIGMAGAWCIWSVWLCLRWARCVLR